MTDEHLLDQLSSAADLERSTVRRLQELADSARQAGHTWAEIATAAGITKAVTHRRWHSPAKQRASEHAARIRAAARGELPFEAPVPHQRRRRPPFTAAKSSIDDDGQTALLPSPDIPDRS